jgi:hypothetical protein
MPQDWGPRSAISDFCHYDVGAVTVASPYGFFLERPGLAGAVQPINRTQR